MPDGVGVVKSIIDKFFERVKSLSRLAMCCILVYVIAHANNLLPEGWSQYLAIPQVAIPWINLVGIIGISWVIVELLWKGWALMGQQVEEWKLAKEEEEKAAQQAQKEKAAIQEFDNILNGKTCPLWETVTGKMYGRRVFEMNAMHPHVIHLCKKYIIELVDRGHLMEDGRHFAKFSFTPWIAEHIAEEEMRAEKEFLQKGDEP